MPPILIEAAAPLAFPSSKPGTQFRASLPYVPGGAIYGVLGHAASRDGWHDPALFRALVCHNAYPALDGDRWVRPLPLTARRPKGEPDAVPRDTLIHQLCLEQQQPAGMSVARGESEAAPGFYTVRAGTVETRDVTQRILTRVAINRRRGTAEDQRLYSPLVINEAGYDPNLKRMEPTRFLGAIDPPPGLPFELPALLALIEHVGGRQSSGLGAVRVEAKPAPPDEPVQRRVEMFNERLAQHAALLGRLAPRRPWPDPARPVIVLNLVADAILLDQGWLPTNALSAAEFAGRTGVAVRPLRVFSATRDLGGYQVVWGRPRPSALATAMGSLFVYEAMQPLGPAAYAALERLEREGVGERRQEGYGRVRVCDDFHLGG